MIFLQLWPKLPWMIKIHEYIISWQWWIYLNCTFLEFTKKRAVIFLSPMPKEVKGHAVRCSNNTEWIHIAFYILIKGNTVPWNQGTHMTNLVRSDIYLHDFQDTTAKRVYGHTLLKRIKRMNQNQGFLKLYILNFTSI